MDWVLGHSGAVACPVLIHGSSFPVYYLYCVGRDYFVPALAMGGHPVRVPPFFFHCISEILLPPGHVLVFPVDSKELLHEVVLVVALGS
jgi:2-keto-4-pentenoate hydratase/2-oxohepta-3-ene-1,7-dioic acid hydratase (catechol pathway)